MQNMGISKAVGTDNLSGRFLKDGAEILAKPLSEIWNLPITSNFFRNACKFAIMKPIIKKDKKTDPSNYRPVLLLPLISKVLWSVIYDQTNASLQEKNLLYNNQSEFRTNLSTNLASHFWQLE